MSDEYVHAESAERVDATQAPEFVQAAEPAAPTEQVAGPGLEATEYSHEAVHRAALEAEQAVTDSQFSEGLGRRN